MIEIRKKHSAAFKAKVAMQALQESQTIAQIASENSIHSTQVSLWKQQLQAKAADLFSDHRKKKSDGAADSRILYEEIGRLKVELEWLKKKTGTLRG